MPEACFRVRGLGSFHEPGCPFTGLDFPALRHERVGPSGKIDLPISREDDPAVDATKTGSRSVTRFRLFPHNQRIDGDGFPGVHDDRVDIHLGKMVLQGDRQMGQFHNAADQS